MKKSSLRISITVSAVAVAFLFAGCEDSASPLNDGFVDGFLVRVNEKPETSVGGSGNTYQVTVNSTGIGATGSGANLVGATVQIYAGTIEGGKFEQWTTKNNDVTFASYSNATTTFIMPAHDVTVTAVFKPIYTVTVSSAGSGATGGGAYWPGTTVSITAGTVPTGYNVFRTWMHSNSGVVFTNINSTATTFTMPSASVTVTAVFVALDSKTYKTATIGGKTWMAENLNVRTSAGSWCYDDADSNCVKYGRLYNWNVAKAVCPSGWHLPSRDEWGALAKAAGGTGDYGTGGDAGKALKSTSGWYYDDGTDSFGFSALPGGERNTSGSFYGAGRRGLWWTATGNGSSAYHRYMGYVDDNVYEGIDDVGFGYSVRCREDD